MKNQFYLFFILNLIIVDNVYSQFVNNGHGNSAFEDHTVNSEALDKGDNHGYVIQNSFLNDLSQQNFDVSKSKINFKIPIFGREEGSSDNDFMRTCQFNYLFSDDEDQEITYPLSNNTSWPFPILFKLQKQYPGSHLGGLNEIIDINPILTSLGGGEWTTPNTRKFYLKGNANDYEGTLRYGHFMEHPHGGIIHTDDPESFDTEECQGCDVDDDMYFVTANFEWLLPAWSLSFTNSGTTNTPVFKTLELFLNIDYEDQEAGRFVFNNEYDNCYNQDMSTSNSSWPFHVGQYDQGYGDSDDEDGEFCDGPEGEYMNLEIPSINWNASGYEQFVTTISNDSNSWGCTYESTDNSVNISLSLPENDHIGISQNSYSYILLENQKYDFEGSDYVPNANYPSNISYNHPQYFVDGLSQWNETLEGPIWNIDESRNLSFENMEPGEETEFKLVYIENNDLQTTNVQYDITVKADVLKEPSDVSVSQLTYNECLVEWVKGSSQPDSRLYYKIYAKCNGCLDPANVQQTSNWFLVGETVKGDNSTSKNIFYPFEPGKNYQFAVETAYNYDDNNITSDKTFSENIVMYNFPALIDNDSYVEAITLNVNDSIKKLNNNKNINLSWTAPNEILGFDIKFKVEFQNNIIAEELITPNYTYEINSEDFCNTQLTFKVYLVLESKQADVIPTRKYTSSSPLDIIINPSHPTIVSGIQASSDSEGITLSWDQEFQNHKIDSYEITIFGANDNTVTLDNNSEDFSVGGDLRQKWTYSGNYLENCESYSFEITSISCGAQESSQLTSVVYNPDVSHSWDNTLENESSSVKKLIASKGDYKNRVELNWESYNQGVISSYEILRREVNDDQVNNDFIKIGETEKSVRHFIDYNTNGNVLYEYKINALIPTCGDSLISNDFTPHTSLPSVGFRVPFSSINGQITYDGNIPVENAEVFASTTNPLVNKSLIHNGDTLFFPRPNDDFSLMMWIKPDFNDDLSLMNILNQINVSDSTSVQLNLKLNQNFSLFSSDTQIYDGSDLFQSDNWKHLSLTYNSVSETLSIYINSEKVLDYNLSNLITSTSNDSDKLEVFDGFNGKIDELSIWSIPLEESFIKLNYNKYIQIESLELEAYYHCDEGNGNYIYDASKSSSGHLNGNHIKLGISSNYFSFDSPTNDQLKYSGYTDIYGYYTINGIRYHSSGANYQVTPTLPAKYTSDNNGNLTLASPAHDFAPTYLTAFLGDGIDYLSNYNFSDMSSFDVSGNVYYLDPDKSDDENCTDLDGAPFVPSENVYIHECNTELPNTLTGTETINYGVEGAFILVDNDPVYDNNGNQVATASDGSFTIQVPIGKHQISVVKDGHTFVTDVWNSPAHSSIIANENSPDAETRRVFNFIENKQGLTFYDNTKRRLVGRVCGGTTEANKPYDGSSINNIGQAEFTLKNVGTEMHSVPITTINSTGEYFVDLLPIPYEVKIDETAGRLFDVPSHEFEGVNAVNNYFLNDIGNGQPYPFGVIDLVQQGNYFFYSQDYYNNIISEYNIREYGNTMILNPITEANQDLSQEDYTAQDSIQRLSDDIISQYIELINNPNSISILPDASDSNPDDFYNYPLLFGIDQSISHETVLQWRNTTIEYDWAENFVYRVKPSISYYSSMYDHDNDEETDSLAIIGEPAWTILNTSWNDSTQMWEEGDSIIIPLILSDGSSQLGNPVFKKDMSYNILTSVQEVYKKYSNNVLVDEFIDPVSIGTLTLNDGRNSNSYTMSSPQNMIPFEPMEVNTSLNGDNSFKKSFTLTYSDGPVSVDKNQDYYVFGSQVNEGLNFFSSGPEVVEMVLRDPPGDQSYSYIENGSSVYNEVSILSSGDNESNRIDKTIRLGTRLQLAIPFGGPILTTDVITNTDVDILAQSWINETEVTTYEDSNSQAYQTSSEEFGIGSGGDLYIAKNYNMVYGTNKYLEVVKVEDCGHPGYVCFGESSNAPDELNESVGVLTLYTDAYGIDYTLGTSVGLEIVPVGFQTKTVYDQNHIVNVLIPTLEWIRSTFFALESVYVRNDFTDHDPSTPNIDYCFDNESHESYDKDNNANPCYTYNEAADLTDPYELPFNVFEDIDIADYIPGGLVGIVEQALLESQTNGVFNGFSQETLDILEQAVSAAEQGQDILGFIGQITESNFWTDFGELLGAQNLLLGLDAFKERVIDYYTDKLTDFTDGMSMLTSVLENMTHTLPNDKVAFYNQQINLWKAAVAANEEDKASIFDDSGSQSGFEPSMFYTETFGPDDNYSFSAGNVIEETVSVSESSTSIQDINFTIDGGIAFKVGLNVNFTSVYPTETVARIPIKFKSKKNIVDTESNYMTFGYVLSDNDESDYISVDVKQSNNGWGPIFRKRAGQTMCPHETEEPFLFYEHNSEDNVFAPATQPREVPGIDINPKTLSGVPEMEQAIFTLSLTNNSASTEDMVYTIMVDEGSNPDGAILKIDGQSVHRDILVPYGETITKTLTVEKGPERFVYSDSTDFGGPDNRLGIILRSSCQYAYGTANIPDIADTVYLAVSFMAGCTDISISEPSDAWVLNKSTEVDTTGASVVNNLNIKLDAYDWNYYSLEDIILEYKKSNQPDNQYNPIETFIKFEDGEENLYNDEELPLGSVNLVWDMYGLEDGDWDIRAYTNCGLASVVSEVHSGHKDTRLPEPFGSPQPADGILSPNDEIQMNWSEAIDENRFYSSQTNITMSAIKNLSEVSHDAFVFMDSGSTLEIPYGLNLQNNSFTVEMWINPESPGTLFEQGYDNNRLSMFINTDNTLGIQYESSGDIVSANSVTNLAMATDQADAWQNVAFVFDNDLKSISFIVNGELKDDNDIKQFSCDYIGEGAVTIGVNNYVGAIHELRVWSTNKYATSIYQTLGTRLSGREAGLIGYWPMDELSGTPQDLSRSRHMTGDVNWAVAKKGFGYDFASDSLILNAPFGTKAYEATDDFTMEFWFKSSGVNECMVSTGSYNIELETGNLDTWSIGLDGQGRISIDHNLNNGSTLLMTSNIEFNDGLWHHLSIVKNAKSNTTMYVDGIEQASCSSEITRGFGSPQLTLGAKQYRNSSDYVYSEFFSGKIDEFRLWNLKRNFSQLNRYKNIRLNGTELGLDIYFPFEQYENTLLMETSTDNADTLNLVLENELSASYESSDLPLVRMSNPYLDVFHNALNNQNQTLLSITEDLANVEGTIIDVSMDNLFDLYGNKANPVTWSFYVDKNQLVWDETSVSIEKSLGEPIVFNTHIINEGGSVESYEITNLPSWLSVSSSQGLLDPNSFEEITFVIDETMFIGDYSEQLLLTGNNGISESLRLQVNVEAEQPNIIFDNEDFQYDMSFIGKVNVDGIRSRDELDMLIAYVDDQPRGISSPIYIEDYDAYFIFMSVYSNEIQGEEINFRLWDASEGKIQSLVKVNGNDNISFYEGEVLGNMNILTSFDATNTLIQEIPLSDGWNWFSINLEADDGSDLGEVSIPTITESINSSYVEIIKDKSTFSQHAPVYGWIGSMPSIKLGSMNMIKLTGADTIIYEGLPVDLSDSIYHLDILNGWNWIGYLGQRPLNINTALSSLAPTPGDLIKNKSNFSIYASESLGWIGTLNTLNEGDGYMLKSNLNQTLIYPETSLYGSGSRIDNNNNQIADQYWSVNSNKYENSMSIIARIDNINYLMPSEENILGGFIGEECVGNISLTKIDQDNSLYFLTIYGTSNDFISFKYFDFDKNKSYISDNILEFESNALVGSIEDPYLIEFDDTAQDNDNYIHLNIYPNPFEEVFTLEFFLEETSKVKIELYDVMGRIVKPINESILINGTHKINIDTELNKGVYFIKLDIDGDLHQKMLIKK